MADLNISVQAKIDDSNDAILLLEKQIEGMSNKIKQAISVKLQIDASQINVLTQKITAAKQKIKAQVETKDSLFINPIVEKQAFATINARYKEVKKNVDELASIRTQYSHDEQGRGKIESATLTYYNKELKQTVTETMRWVESSKNVNGQLENFKTFRTVGMDIKDDMAQATRQTQNLINSLKSFKDEMLGIGNLRGKIDIFSEKQKGKYDKTALEDFENQVKALNISTPDLNNKIKELSTQFGLFNAEAGQSGSVLSRALENMGKFLRFYLVGGMLVGVIREFKQAIGYVNEFSNSLNEIRIVTGKSIPEINRLGKEFNTLAKELKVTTKSLTDASIEFFRQGLTVEEVMERSKIATQHAKVANQDFKSSAEILTAVVNAMGINIERASDVMLYLGDSTATSADEIGRAMQKVAGAAGALQIPFEKIASYVAVISARTRESAETIGTSLNAMLARFTKLTETGFNEDDDTKINDVAKALNSVNIALTDASGNFRRFDVIIDELGKQWGGLDTRTRAYLATALSGTRQQSRFYSLLQGTSEAMDLYNGAMESANITNEKYGIYMESNAAKADEFRAVMEGLWIKTINAKSIGKVIELGTAFMTLVDKVGLLNIALFVTVGYFALIKGYNITEMLINLSSIFVLLYEKVVALNLAFSSFVPLLAVTGVIVAVKVFKELNVTLEEQKEIVEELSSKLRDLKRERDELNKKEDKTSEELRYLKILEKEIELKKEDLQTEKEKALMKEFLTPSFFSGGIMITGTEKIENTIFQVKKLRKELENLEVGKGSYAKSKKLSEKIVELELSLISSRKTLKDYIDTLDNVPQSIIDIVNIIDDLIVEEDKLKNSVDDTTDAIDKGITSTEELVKTLSSSRKELSDINSALEDYNKSGKFSIDTILKLSETYPELLGLLNDEKALYGKLIEIQGEKVSSVQDGVNKQLVILSDAMDRIKDAYGADVKNFANAELAKEAIANKFAQNLMALQSRIYETTGLAQLNVLKNWESNLANQSSILGDVNSIIERYYTFKSIDISGVLTGGKGTGATGGKSANLKYIEDIQELIRSYTNLNDATEKWLSNKKKELQIAKDQKDYNAQLKITEEIIEKISGKNGLLSSYITEQQAFNTEANKLRDANKQFKTEDWFDANAEKTLAFQDQYRKANEQTREEMDKLFNKLQALKKAYGESGVEISKLKDYLLELGVAFDTVQENIGDALLSGVRKLIETERKIEEEVLYQKEQRAKEELAELEKAIYIVSEKEFNNLQRIKINALEKEIRIAESKLKNKKDDIVLQNQLIALQSELTYEQDKTYDSLTNFKEIYEEIANNKIRALEEELEALEKEDKYLKEQEEREKRIAELQELQLKLKNLQTQKTVQQLKQTSEGVWQFEYVSDQKAIDDVQKNIKDKQDSLDKWERDNALNQQKEMLKDQIRYEKDVLSVKQDSYRKQEQAQNQALNAERDAINKHYRNMDVLVADRLDEVRKTNNGKWDLILSDITHKLSVAEEKYATLLGTKSSIDKLIKEILESMEDLEDYGGEVPTSGKGSTKSKGLSAADLKEIERLEEQYASARASLNWEGMYTSHMKAQKIRGLTTNDAAADIDYIKKLRKELYGYDTGGYTGTWNSKDGKLALLHQKELVLKESDTSNILKVVDITRQLVDKLKMPDFSKVKLGSSTDKSLKIGTLNLAFPNVKDASGVGDSILGLPMVTIQKVRTQT